MRCVSEGDLGTMIPGMPSLSHHIVLQEKREDEQSDGGGEELAVEVHIPCWTRHKDHLDEVKRARCALRDIRETTATATGFR